MIWVRRFFVLPVGAVFLVLLAFTLVGSRASATLYDPDFYKRHLAEQDVYSFVLSDLAAAAIEELRRRAPGHLLDSAAGQPHRRTGTVHARTGPVRQRRVSAPEWVQGQLEGVIDQVVGYLNGERDDLDIRVAIDERVPAATDELKSTLATSRIHELVLRHYAAPEVDETLAQGAAPLGAQLEAWDVLAAIDRSVPSEWLIPHVEAAIDEVAAYMSSRQDTLEIHVPLYERADILEEELIALFDGPDLDGGQLAEPWSPLSWRRGCRTQSSSFRSGVSLTACGGCDSGRA